jgi:hypothetical protein
MVRVVGWGTGAWWCGGSWISSPSGTTMNGIAPDIWDDEQGRG